MSYYTDDPKLCGWCKHWDWNTPKTGDTYNDKERGKCVCSQSRCFGFITDAHDDCEQWEEPEVTQ